MFGKIRASSCPAESLERPPSKILKDDSLSIYEATLVKLKLGSKRNLSPCSNEVGEIDTDTGSTSSSPDSDPMKIEVNCASTATSPGCLEVPSSPREEVMSVDIDCSSLSSTSSSDCHSMGTCILKQQRSANVSVLYLFSKFKRAQDGISSCSSSRDAMAMEDVRISTSSSGCQSHNSTEPQLEQECISPSPVSHIKMSKWGCA